MLQQPHGMRTHRCSSLVFAFRLSRFAQSSSSFQSLQGWRAGCFQSVTLAWLPVLNASAKDTDGGLLPFNMGFSREM
eukprot:2571102-Pyramimonas_sp.AAC.1